MGTRAAANAAEHEAQSLGFLRAHATGPASALAEEADEGFLPIGDGLIHWRGERGAERLILHLPGEELVESGVGEVAIDVPGHGLSSHFADAARTIEAARDALGARHVVWPTPPEGDPVLLYPDLAPDRFGAHLIRAWSVVRAAALFRPWYGADADHALPVDPAVLDPEVLARRTRALLRAGPAAANYHRLVAERPGGSA